MTARLVGLDDFKRDLRQIDRKLVRVVGRANKKVAQTVVTDATQRARSAYGAHASQVKGIKPSGTQKRAAVNLNPARAPRLFAAEYGAIVHPVAGRFMTQDRFRRRVFRPWSGNQWTGGRGPDGGVGYAVNPAIRDLVASGKIPGMFLDATEEAFAEAFPERGL